jgi:hypothetical protein
MQNRSWENGRKASLRTIFVTNERWLIIVAVVGLCLGADRRSDAGPIFK